MIATKAGLHWFWRGMIAGFVGIAANGAADYWLLYKAEINSPLGVYPIMYPMWYRPIHTLKPWLGEGCATLATFAVYRGAATLAAAFGAYWLLAHWLGSNTDGELHCRRCDHILRGLSEPRCPECDEPI
jgi:hypothetical protein